MQHQKGFSLVELMVTIAILAIIISIAIPSFSNWVKNTRLSGAAEQIQSTFSYAKSESIKRNKGTCLLISNPNTDTWSLKITSDCTDSTVLQEITSSDYNKTIRLTLDAASKINKTRFDPRSQRPGFDNNNGTIKTTQSLYLGIDNYKLKIELSPAGLITICNSGTKNISGYAVCA
ncbi:GspH/FimT family pseudopilin [Chitinibacter sp. FCG-7]|uniref:Type II secretion system protein H n=1 Tax=Chitinibacter mangrovi TaxID=3153927 RepID=A0AAU7F8Y1_9NEIS